MIMKKRTININC